MNQTRIVSLVLCLCSALGCAGQIVRDGTLGGTAGALTGPHFQITADLGRKIGPNLFHSFSQFNLARRESATFSGPTDVQNILARVTGGSASSINGLLKSDIAGANFYLINPAGVMFGLGASIDVSGAFKVSTADYIKLADGGRFDASNPGANEALLTAAPPVAFGFLGSNPGDISVQDGFLKVRDGQALAFVGGDVQLDSATLQAPAGSITLVSVKSPGEVADSPKPSLAAFSTGGSIAADASVISTSGEGGGQVVIRGGKLALNGTSVYSTTLGAQNAEGIDVEVKGDFSLRGGSIIDSTTRSSGDGGNIQIKADSLLLRSDDTIAHVLSQSEGAETRGDGGDISIEARQIELSGPQALIISLTDGVGDAGNVKITAEHFLIDGENTGGSTGVQVALYPTSTGGGGDIAITADTLEVLDGGNVGSLALGSANGGSLKVNAGTILIQGKTTGLSAQTEQGFTGKRGGSVTIRADRVELLAGAQITTSTFNSGAAGKIEITAKTIRIDGQGLDMPTGLGAQTLGALGGGRGGNIIVRASHLEILGGSGITGSTFGSGAAGDIRIRAGHFTIDGQGLDLFTGIAATAEEESSGRGGTVNIHANELLVAGKGLISARSLGSGDGGAVRIVTGTLSLRDEASINSVSEGSGDSGRISIKARGALRLQGSAISTAADNGDARGIDIRSGSVIDLQNSQIIARAAQNGGNIQLSGLDRIDLLESTVEAAAQVSGGNISIGTHRFVSVPEFRGTLTSTLLSANADPVAGSGGNIRLGQNFSVSADSILTATGGDPGIVQVGVPGIDLGASLIPLFVPPPNAESRLPDHCGKMLSGDMSSFIILGRGGVALSPDGWLPAVGP